MNKLGLSPKKQVPFDVDEEPVEIDSKTKTEMFRELGKQGGSRQDLLSYTIKKRK